MVIPYRQNGPDDCNGRPRPWSSLLQDSAHSLSGKGRIMGHSGHRREKGPMMCEIVVVCAGVTRGHSRQQQAWVPYLAVGADLSVH